MTALTLTIPKALLVFIVNQCRRAGQEAQEEPSYDSSGSSSSNNSNNSSGGGRDDSDSDFDPSANDFDRACKQGKGGRAKKKGGRWGGGRAGSDPSVLQEDPYASREVDGVVTAVDAREDAVGKSRVSGERSGDVGRVDARAGKADRGISGGTLVVCPLTLIGQWRTELETKTRKGALTVCFHYGPGRSRWEGGTSQGFPASAACCAGPHSSSGVWAFSLARSMLCLLTRRGIRDFSHALFFLVEVVGELD